jgi:hypothetical protein
MRQTIKKCEYLCGTITERSASKTTVRTWGPHTTLKEQMRWHLMLKACETYLANKLTDEDLRNSVKSVNISCRCSKYLPVEKLLPKMSYVSQHKNQKCLIPSARRRTHTYLGNLTHFTPSHYMGCNFHLACLVHFICDKSVIQATYLRTLWEHYGPEINHFEPRHRWFQQDVSHTYCALLCRNSWPLCFNTRWLAVPVHFSGMQLRRQSGTGCI